MWNEYEKFTTDKQWVDYLIHKGVLNENDKDYTITALQSGHAAEVFDAYFKNDCDLFETNAFLLHYNLGGVKPKATNNGNGGDDTHEQRVREIGYKKVDYDLSL